MVDIFPTFSHGSTLGVSINVTGTAVTGAALTGDWITPLNGQHINAMAIQFSDGGGGTLTDAGINVQYLIGDDATVYTLVNGANSTTHPATYTVFIATTGNWMVPLAPLGLTAGNYMPHINGLKAIRALAAVTGTGATTDVLKITFVGHPVA